MDEECDYIFIQPTHNNYILMTIYLYFTIFTGHTFSLAYTNYTTQHRTHIFRVHMQNDIDREINRQHSIKNQHSQ